MPDAQPPTADPAAPSQDLTGRTLGDYQLLRRLGIGGMGQVYLARQLSLKRDVAVKLLRNDLASNPTALLRFQAEAEAVARLNHPNIVHIHQIGEHEGLRYMVLEYVEGRNLREYLLRKGPPDTPVTLSIVRQITLALQKAHEQGIVHRDIKPENVLVTRKVEVKVTDFGLSRFFSGQPQATHLTQSGVTLGTPLYMAPEQVQGQVVDHRTDIYSLGVTCYHLLAGEPPFRGTTAFDVALKHVQEQARPLADLRPDLPADLCGLVHKMMAKNPADRYQSAREILRDLTRLRDAGSQSALATGAIPSLSLSVPSQTELPVADGLPAASGAAVTAGSAAVRGRWVLAGLLCLIGGAGGAFLSYSLTRPTPEPAPASPAPPPAPPGLPDVRPPERLVSTRERELLAVLANRLSQPEDVLKAHIELGLMYVREQRFDEAQNRFERLEKEEVSRTAMLIGRTMSMAGRLGQAIVLAYREPAKGSKESHQTLAQASNDLVMKVVTDPFTKSAKFDKFDKGYPAVAAFLLRHPDLAQALAEALNRNMITLGKSPPLTPSALESLRVPPKGAKKD